jgi:hypothetical protein
MTSEARSRSAACIRLSTPGAARAGPRSATHRASERGMIMLWSVATVVIVASVVMTGTLRLKAVDEVARAEFSAKGQAREVAEAGLVDAYAWFRRQQIQPVAAFAPRRNMSAVPPINETDDASQGLVRQFEISPEIWGRYRVQQEVPPEPFTDANGNGFYDPGETFTDVDGDNKRGCGRGNRDVTTARGLVGAGSVWLLESRAQVFRRPRADLPLGQDPNLQIAEATLGAEIRRLAMVPPATAAICCSSSGALSLGARTRIRSSGTCVAYGLLTSLPILSGSELLGSLSTALVPGWKDKVEDVFGVDLAVLRGMADVSTSDTVKGVTSPLPDSSLVVITGDITFDAARPLKGTAVVVVKGNVTINPGSNSFFSGMLYVDGNLTVRAPALIRGTVIARGTVDIRGTGGDYVEIESDPDILTRLMSLMGQYRYSKAVYEPALKRSDGRPTETRCR